MHSSPENTKDYAGIINRHYK